jgi:hypothetical protein
VHNEPLASDTRLSVVAGTGGNSDGARAVEVGGRHDDEGIRTAQFHDRFLDVLTSPSCDRATRGLRTREGDRFDSTIINHGRDGSRTGQDCDERAFGESGAREQRVEVQARVAG